MKKFGIYSRLVCGSAMVAMIALANQSQAATGKGVVKEVEGDATYNDGMETKVVKVGTEIKPGTTVMTSEGSHVVVGLSSELGGLDIDSMVEGMLAITGAFAPVQEE